MTEVAESGVASSFARAKVNLYLHVIGRRGDGYHLLDSLVVFPEIGDTVLASRANHLSLVVEGPFADGVPRDSGNTLIRAAYALAEEANVAPGAELRLDKQIPVASGMGGGSADAAAALRALVALWRLDLPSERISALALRLGADVPMCLGSYPALVGGIGQVLDPVPFLPAFTLLLVNPRQELSTSAVFAARRPSFSQVGRFSPAPADAWALARVLSKRHNDLTETAIRLCPAVGEVLTALASLEDALLVRMSGSGATCFALFAEGSSAERQTRRLRQDHPGWWMAVAPVAATRNSD